ncbi:MAG TPA: hypothetical protein VIE47_04995, partial [Methylocystis sp.]
AIGSLRLCEPPPHVQKLEFWIARKRREYKAKASFSTRADDAALLPLSFHILTLCDIDADVLRRERYGWFELPTGVGHVLIF